jgi:hypothetical protein
VKNEIFLKILVIFFMASSIFALSISGYWMRVNHNDTTLFLHMSVGTIFLIFLPLHIYLRREKLVRMVQDFYNILTSKYSEESCKNNKLLKTLKQRALKDICVH